MANPVIIKALLVAATDKRTWKAIAVIIAVVLTPFILLILLLCSLFAEGTEQNKQMADLVFSDIAIDESVSVEQKQVIEVMRKHFAELDNAIKITNSKLDEGSLDSLKVKAVFYCLYIGVVPADEDDIIDYQRIVDCFIEEITQTDGIMIIAPVQDDDKIYDNLNASLDVNLDETQRTAINSIYSYLISKGISS